MPDSPFKMPGFPRHSVTPKSPVKLLPIASLVGAAGSMAYEKLNKHFGPLTGMGLENIPVIGNGLNVRNPIARYAVDKIDEWRADGKKPSKTVKKKKSKTIDYGEKDDSPHNVSARRTEGTIEQQKKRRLKQQLKKYGPGHPKRKDVYDALNWKYDETIKK